MLTDYDRFQLKKMVEAHSVEDNTSKIREMQHSGEIRRCVNYIIEKKQKNNYGNKAELEAAISGECGFLFFHYFDIYNMVLKDCEVDLLNKFIDVLQSIEEGKCDQHEGSYLVGKVLKEIYIDTVLKETVVEEGNKKAASKDITWRQYRNGA
jgi:hypothetical protein